MSNWRFKSAPCTLVPHVCLGAQTASGKPVRTSVVTDRASLKARIPCAYYFLMFCLFTADVLFLLLLPVSLDRAQNSIASPVPAVDREVLLEATTEIAIDTLLIFLK